MDRVKKREVSRKKRAFRIRKKITGTAERPRLCVKRSLKHISAQIIDDKAGHTIVMANSYDKDIVEKLEGSKTDVSKLVGEIVAERALEKGINEVVFDRKGYPYHGRIKAFAEGTRKKGLKF